MSDLEEPGWPRVQPTGGSVAGAVGGSSRAFGAWECLLLALAQPNPRATNPRRMRGKSRCKCAEPRIAPDGLCARCGRRKREAYKGQAQVYTADRWSRHAVDALRILAYGFDTLYAGEEGHHKNNASSHGRKPHAPKSNGTDRATRPRVRNRRAA